jgi:anaerobic ribonucleoside-triphosphate reductase activating protein
MSRDTWAAARDTIGVAALLEAITPWRGDADGATISGGEPFDQPDALLELLQGLRAAGNLSVLVYSGYPYERLQDRHGPILSLVDVLISEPFEAAQAVIAPLRGSAMRAGTCTRMWIFGRMCRLTRPSIRARRCGRESYCAS